MRFDIASLSMAILWNIIFISVVFVMEKKKVYTSRKGIQIILIFYLMGVIRMLFPADFQPSIGIPISNGKRQKRRWNKTKNRWEDPAWKDM